MDSHFHEWKEIIGLAIGCGSVIVTCVWCVSSIKNAVALLGKDVNNLSATIKELKQDIHFVRNGHQTLDRRLTVLETISSQMINSVVKTGGVD